MQLPSGRARAIAALLALTVLAATPEAAASVSAAPGPSVVTHVPVARGCFVVAPWLAGVKVYLVQRALGLHGHRERYDAATRAAVGAFQATHGLPVTRRVDRTTWQALHTGRRFCIDRYTPQPTLPIDATSAQRRRSLLRFARAQVGRRYIWGGAGPIGYDCSGLALQAMHAAGLSIPAITTADHQHSDFPSGAVIFAHAGLHRVRFALRRPGDLVFWAAPGSAPGSIEHVAVYVGHDRVVEAVRPRIRVASVWSHPDLVRKGRVVRPFPR
jgi:hypothetical protein